MVTLRADHATRRLPAVTPNGAPSQDDCRGTPRPTGLTMPPATRRCCCFYPICRRSQRSLSALCVLPGTGTARAVAGCAKIPRRLPAIALATAGCRFLLEL